ncbi:mitotic spindle checkpoint protein Bub3 [Schizosaccharomyces japonicus yFS275]|uniref:Mitotic spindle checkpoint protein Bub3 n=1 Tax=Schizosaccharomyces japonicus (strain yFS275 / FY16936) TaxID=402676 RepID=B6K2I1_SCHJY|nr:mitotic spindle checkpoint protein Bub3 [Schizosaccharomyces japonicus yFS275]EEB07362.1 mitotic spindle checkpoint protein Bub3 [Schizosaccharomyces japonicus yFS275]
MSTSIVLYPTPKDGVTRVKFVPGVLDELLVASWDGSLQYFSTNKGGELKLSIPHNEPVLSMSFCSPTQIVSGYLHGELRVSDLTTGEERAWNAHSLGVCDLINASSIGCTISASWDKTLQFWDPRAQTRQHKQELAGKPFTISNNGYRLAVGCSMRENLVFDVRNMQEPLLKKPSSFKYMTRRVCLLPDNEGFVSSSIEGRTSVEFLNPAPDWQARNFTFKCHRQTQGDQDIVYPVNALAFHPIHGTLATAGGDGAVAVWDLNVRKRLRLSKMCKTSISDIDFNSNGTLLVVGTCAEEKHGEVHIQALDPEYGAPKRKA